MRLFICIVFLIIGYGAFFFVLHAFFSLVRGGCGKFAPFVATSGLAKQEMLTLARNRLKKVTEKQLIVDLGSGTGTLLIPLAKEFPMHCFLGYEWDFIPLMWAKWRSRKLKNIEWRRQNFMAYHCGEADILFCYILKTMSEPLGKKLSLEIKDSCLVISELFPLNYLPQIGHIKSSLCGMPVHLYLYQKASDKTGAIQKKAD